MAASAALLTTDMWPEACRNQAKRLPVASSRRRSSGWPPELVLVVAAPDDPLAGPEGADVLLHHRVELLEGADRRSREIEIAEAEPEGGGVAVSVVEPGEDRKVSEVLSHLRRVGERLRLGVEGHDAPTRYRQRPHRRTRRVPGGKTPRKTALVIASAVVPQRRRAARPRER